MYKEHFGLKELPFSIAPDPRYLFMSEQHREALAHLVFGINSGGFVLLTGEVGTGKTTICRCLLEQAPENADIAFILNPKMTVEELLATFCDELGIHYPAGNKSIKVFVDLINTYLLDAYSRGRKTVLIIEEAQNLDPEVLEQIRLLTNLETDQQKLLQIIMIGQPELRDMLSRPEMLQLSQRITARYHIEPLSEKETGAYVNHRLTVAGTTNSLFPDPVIRELYRLSRGIPRLINVICDRALLGAYAQGKDRVDKRTLVKAAREVFGGHNIKRVPAKALKWSLAGLVIIICGAALAATYFNHRTQLLPVNAKSVSHVEIRKLDSFRLPENYSMKRSKDQAFQALSREWDIQISEKSPFCKQVQAKGLHCFEKSGSLSELISLNRPAVLKLYTDQSHQFYGTLTSLNGENAALSVANETMTVELKEIEKHWFGDYVLLFKVPQGLKGAIRPGSKGTEVEWLDRQISLAQGQKTQTRKHPVYDDELVSQVKKFQLSVGLIPDGVVGSQTIIHLSNAVGSSEPLLVKRGKAK